MDSQGRHQAINLALRRAIEELDHKSADYNPLIMARLEHGNFLRKHPSLWSLAKQHYATNWIDFCGHWACTYSPWLALKGQPPLIPFSLFPKQKEYMLWLAERSKENRPCAVKKCREVGMSWLSIAAASAVFLFSRGAAIGFGSATEEKLDRIGDPGTVFEKIRILLRNLPPELWPKKFDPDKHCAFKKIINPETGATIVGEIGDEMGRSGRTSIYFVDEAAFVPHPERSDAGIAFNAYTPVYISTMNGTNEFWRKCQTYPSERVFTFFWSDDPRKDDAWFQAKKEDLPPEIFASEVLMDPYASIENVVIPQSWVQSAMKIKLEASGTRMAGLDVSDEGQDAKAYVQRKGPVVEYAEDWKTGDCTDGARKAWGLARTGGVEILCFDEIGVGAGAKAEFRHLRAKSEKIGMSIQGVGNEKLEGLFEGGKPNKDVFGNYRAMAIWSLRRRFERTHQHVTGQRSYPDEELISLPNHPGLESEISRLTYFIKENGKIGIESKRDLKKRGVPSPNLFDALVLAFTPCEVVHAGRMGMDWRGGRGSTLWNKPRIPVLVLDI